MKPTEKYQSNRAPRDFDADPGYQWPLDHPVDQLGSEWLDILLVAAILIAGFSLCIVAGYVLVEMFGPELLR